MKMNELQGTSILHTSVIKMMIREVIREELQALKREQAELYFHLVKEELSKPETCEILQVSRTTIDKYEQQGELNRISNEGQPKYRKQEVMRLYAKKFLGLNF